MNQTQLRHRSFFVVLVLALSLCAPWVVEADVSNIVFTTTPQSAGPGVISDVLTLQVQDANGAAVSGGIPQTGCIALTSTSPTGQFSSSATSWNSVSVLTMNKGSSNRNFYYQDLAAGVYTLTAAFVLKPTTVTASCANWPQSGWGAVLSATQSITIGASQTDGQDSGNNDQSPPANIPDETGAASTTQVAVVQTGAALVPTLGVDIKTEPSVMVGGGSFFSGSAFEPGGTKAINVRYLWNFGDGATDQGQTVFHTYVYPGKYVVGLTVAAGDEAGMGRTSVQAVPAQIGLLAQNDGSVVLSNQAVQEINIGLWSISSGTSTFSIPQDTIILAGQSVRFAPTTMNMSAGSSTQLRYPNNAPVATAVITEIKAAPAQFVPSSVPTPALSKKIKSSATRKIAPQPSLLPTSTNVTATAMVPQSMPFLVWILAGSGVVLITLAGLLYAGVGWRNKPPETIMDASEFEIE